MFVDVVGVEGQEKTGSSKTETKVGVDSKYNLKEAELVVQFLHSIRCTNASPVLSPCTG